MQNDENLVHHLQHKISVIYWKNVKLFVQGEVLSAFKKFSEEKKSGGNSEENNDISKYKKEVDELKNLLKDMELNKNCVKGEKEKLEKLLTTAEEGNV